mgnify:CR=1 FL=1
MTIMIRLYLPLVSLLVAPYISAEVYKCTAANGDVVFQGEPCRGGDEVKVDIRFGEQQAVDINQIRALFQQMLAADFSSGVIVSYAGFSSQAWIFAREANIELLDARSLKKQQKLQRQQQFAMV